MWAQQKRLTIMVLWVWKRAWACVIKAKSSSDDRNWHTNTQIVCLFLETWGNKRQSRPQTCMFTVLAGRPLLLYSVNVFPHICFKMFLLHLFRKIVPKVHNMDYTQHKQHNRLSEIQTISSVVLKISKISKHSRKKVWTLNIFWFVFCRWDPSTAFLSCGVPQVQLPTLLTFKKDFSPIVNVAFVCSENKFLNLYFQFRFVDKIALLLEYFKTFFM